MALARGPHRLSPLRAAIAIGLACLAALAVLLASGAFDDGGDGGPRIYWGAWISGEVYAPEGREAQPDAPWSEGTWNRFVSDAGKEVSIVHFGQPAPWNEPFEPEPFEHIAARGAIPLLDMDSDGVSLAQIAAGAKDSYFEEWAAAARRFARPFFLRWEWEMNGSWFQWGKEAAADPSVYVDAWRHVHEVVAGAGATNVTWVWCPHVTSPATTPIADLYPGDSYVDWSCMDGYNGQEHRAGAAGSSSFGEIFGQTYRELLALAPGKPIMIGETASAEVEGPPTKPEWIADALARELPERFPRVKALVWFNWNIPAYSGGPRLDWPIESSPASQAAFARAVSSSYYAPASALPAPTPLAPVPPLP